jgi:hypothetical protein
MMCRSSKEASQTDIPTVFPITRGTPLLMWPCTRQVQANSPVRTPPPFPLRASCRSQSADAALTDHDVVQAHHRRAPRPLDLFFFIWRMPALVIE